ncbi:hypothetical protein HNQ60_000004 [Povalibacter uvarum]|uniref:Cytochrome P460 domain-containing protein n=1 Tax=Povalibacter uvarum TaxID=732238 RepID=A0A841HFT1_9GAMM|nr:cytochrome P460 family protein [Povalibacter uvarum]MBB6091158.1 hypothetical protein [Povalibacter uvarum]
MKAIYSVMLTILVLVGSTGTASAADKYAVRIPDGVSLSEFKGYETWEVVSVSHTDGGEGMGGDETFNVIVANPVMIKAYAAGIPGNGQSFPDGAKAVKIQYAPKKSTEAPFKVSIPDRLKDVAVMVKDSKRFAGSGGWGYGLFDYKATTDGFAPNGTGAKCGAACHTIVKAKDYVFTRYERK